ncbi:MAG: hypothetical protein DI547_15825 [Sphingobium sp.]|jgi:hypothetical protein|nr:MAG: hypothetical protein DI547_15825 [Sphingobium sp.]
MLMSNRERPPARLHYMPYSFRVLSAGDHVLCAVSGQRIPLEDLRYWSIARQEAYASAALSVEAELQDRAKRGLVD